MRYKIFSTFLLCTSQYKSLPPPSPPPPESGTSRALARHLQHFFSLLVNQIISKANKSYSPLCLRSGGARIYIDWCISAFIDIFTYEGKIYIFTSENIVLRNRENFVFHLSLCQKTFLIVRVRNRTKPVQRYTFYHHARNYLQLRTTTYKKWLQENFTPGV